MKKNDQNLFLGLLTGAGLAAGITLGFQNIIKKFWKKKDVTKKKPETISEHYFSFPHIRSQILIVCAKLKLKNEKEIIKEYFPHIETEQTFEFDTSYLKPIDVAEYIDHTQLKANSKTSGIKKLCDEAKRHKFASVCVNGCNVKFCKKYLGDEVPIAAVIGFPLGSMTTESKEFETRQLIQAGAQEIDMVMNVGKLKEGDYEYVYRDILAVCNVNKDIVVKVIMETCYLTPNEVIISSILSVLAGAAFVKTSTGFGTGGAKIQHVKLMKRVVGENAQVKASGGIRSFEDAINMLGVGASRLGCSSGCKIVQHKTSTSGY